MFAARTDCERTLKIRERIVQLAAFHQQRAEICQGDVVIGRDRQRARPKRFAIPPISRLLPGARAQDDDNAAANDRENFFSVP